MLSKDLLLATPTCSDRKWSPRGVFSVPVNMLLMCSLNRSLTGLLLSPIYVLPQISHVTSYTTFLSVHFPPDMAKHVGQLLEPAGHGGLVRSDETRDFLRVLEPYHPK